MLFASKRRWAMIWLCLAVVAWPVLAAEEAEQKPANETTADTPDQEEPPDPYAVPDGPPAELAAFIQTQLRTRPPNAEARKKAIAAMQEAADRILAGEFTAGDAQVAVQVKTMFATSATDLEELAEKLKKAGKAALSRQVHGAALGRKVQEAARGRDDDRKEQVLQLIEQIKTHLAEGPLQNADISLAMNSGRTVETLGDNKLAADTYAGFAKLLAASDNQRIAESSKTLEGVGRRLNLVGKEVKVEGTLLAGEKFEWAKYRGKVVLVDFWATWCPPCVAEVPNMKKMYDLYHDRGFEVVGISLDRGREPLEKFIEEREIPWTILYDEGGKSPSATYYGVMAIPTMILVGQDGKAVSTRARGEQLRKELDKLLGPVEEKVAEEEGGSSEADTSGEKG